MSRRATSSCRPSPRTTRDAIRWNVGPLGPGLQAGSSEWWRRLRRGRTSARLVGLAHALGNAAQLFAQGPHVGGQPLLVGGVGGGGDADQRAAHRVELDDDALHLVV